jgi:hypothetical protein
MKLLRGTVLNPRNSFPFDVCSFYYKRSHAKMLEELSDSTNLTNLLPQTRSSRAAQGSKEKRKA